MKNYGKCENNLEISAEDSGLFQPLYNCLSIWEK